MGFRAAIHMASMPMTGTTPMMWWMFSVPHATFYYCAYDMCATVECSGRQIDYTSKYTQKARLMGICIGWGMGIVMMHD